MARDVVLRHNEVVSKTYVRFAPPHPQFGTIWNERTRTGSYKQKQTQRADIRYGNHSNELGYWANFYSCDAMPMRLWQSRTMRWPHIGTSKFSTSTHYWEGLHPCPSDGFRYAQLTGFPGYLVSDASAAAIAKASRSQNNLTQSGAEAAFGAKQILSQLGSAAKFLNALRRGDSRGAARALGISGGGSLPRAAANNYLAWSFGWLPLMSDIYNAHSKISSAFERRDGLLKSSSTRSTSWTPYLLSNQYFYEGSLKAVAKVGITYRVSSATAAAYNSLGLTNPLLIAWQLMPFSFMVDWFANVGKVLESLSGFIGLSFRDGYITKFQKGTLVLKTSLPFYGFDLGTPPSWKQDIAGMERTKLLSVPKPRLYIRFGLDPGKVGTVLALLAQRT